MSDDQKWRELVDAMRPSDEGQPEFAHLAGRVEGGVELDAVLERSHRLDRQLGEAIAEVDIPEGLAERLLDGIAAEAASVTIPERAPSKLRRRRQFVWSAVVTLTSAAVLTAFVKLNMKEQPKIQSAWEIANAAPQWVRHVSAAKWQPMMQLPLTYSPPAGKAQLRRWQWVKPGELQPVVCYQLTTGSRDYLFSFPEELARVQMTVPPARPNFATAGYCVSVWKSRGFVHVLVMEGSADRYEQLFPRPSKIAQRGVARAAGRQVS